MYNIPTFITFFISGKNPVIWVSPVRQLLFAIYLEIAHSIHLFVPNIFLSPLVLGRSSIIIDIRLVAYSIKLLSVKNRLCLIIDRLAATDYRSWNCNQFPSPVTLYLFMESCCFLFQLENTKFVETTRQLWMEERLWMFTKGLTARLVQSITFSFCIILGYETIKRFSLLEEYKSGVRWWPSTDLDLMTLNSFVMINRADVLAVSNSASVLEA